MEPDGANADGAAASGADVGGSGTFNDVGKWKSTYVLW